MLRPTDRSIFHLLPKKYFCYLVVFYFVYNRKKPLQKTNLSRCSIVKPSPNGYHHQTPLWLRVHCGMGGDKNMVRARESGSLP